MEGEEIQITPPEEQCEGSQSSNSWVIPEKFHERYRKPSSSVCIYRVPELFTSCKREAYHPEFVSFGPFHHNKQQGLSAMEGHKVEAVHKTLKRLNGKSIQELVTEIKSLEENIRNCYEEIEYDSDTLTWMMTLDGCFILEFLRTVYAEEKKEEFSLIFINSTVDNTIQCGILKDILKLENQIPLVILISILKLEFHDKAEFELIEILRKCQAFQCYPFSYKNPEQKCESQSKHARHLELYRNSIIDAGHLLDLCTKMITHFLRENSDPESMPSRSNYYEIPRAELLHNAGIQFKTCDEGNLRFEKRTFRSSTLFLPRILMEDMTEATLRNLIIFEEYEKLKEKKNVISNYMSFMNKLIDSEKDVALLTKEGIIISCLGSDEEVAAVFNNLDKGTYIAGIKQFVDVADQVKAEYERKLKVLMSQFIEEHCSKPWYIVSLVAAVLILGMTAVQTVYSVEKS